jgi:hypothetical protein
VEDFIVRSLSLLMFYIALVLGLSACQQGGNLSLENGRTFDPNSLAAAGAEFVPSSNQHAISTVNGYKAQQSVGGTFSQVKQQSTGGYKLYSNVQGILISQ